MDRLLPLLAMSAQSRFSALLQLRHSPNFPYLANVVAEFHLARPQCMWAPYARLPTALRCKQTVASPETFLFSSLYGSSGARLSYAVPTSAPRLLIFSSLDGSISVRLKLCCTAAPRYLIFSSLDDSSSVRLKLCCTPAPRLLIFSSLDGSISVRLKLCCTATPRLSIFSSLDGSSRINLHFIIVSSAYSYTAFRLQFNL